MRRKDREITGLDNMLAILDECEVMRLGLCADDQPYIVPLNFAYQVTDEALSVYFHCACEGRKMDIIAKNNKVCFEADCAFRIVKAESACNWSANYKSIMGEGIIEQLIDTDQKIMALNLIMKRYGYEGVPQYNPETVDKVAVLRINVSSMTAKGRQA